jgi:hypothetical protein
MRFIDCRALSAGLVWWVRADRVFVTNTFVVFEFLNFARFFRGRVRNLAVGEEVTHPPVLQMTGNSVNPS